MTANIHIINGDLEVAAASIDSIRNGFHSLDAIGAMNGAESAMPASASSGAASGAAAALNDLTAALTGRYGRTSSGTRLEESAESLRTMHGTLTHLCEDAQLTLARIASRGEAVDAARAALRTCITSHGEHIDVVAPLMTATREAGDGVVAVRRKALACLNYADAHPQLTLGPDGAVTQEGAPYPADMGHLDDILSIGKGHQLPDNAQALSVDPATNFAKDMPGGWGYIIAFTATDQAIRDYVTTYTGYLGKNIEIFPQSRPDNMSLEDVDLSTITNPWNTGFDDTTLLLERPLGRGWLIIRGGSR